MSERAPINAGSVAYGYCHNGWSVTAPFTRQLLRFVYFDYAPPGDIPGEGAHYHRNFYDQGGLYLPDNRNALVYEFLKADPSLDWLWMLDTDVEFKPDTLHRLLMTGKPLVSAYYENFHGEFEPPKPVWYVKADNLHYRIFDAAELRPNQVVEIDAAGPGCILIHRDVLEAIASRHPHTWSKWFDEEQLGPNEPPMREAFVFARRAKAAGFQMYGLPYLVDHVKTQRIRAFAAGSRSDTAI